MSIFKGIGNDVGIPDKIWSDLPNFSSEKDAEIERLRNLVVALTSGGASLYGQGDSARIPVSMGQESLLDILERDD